MTTQQPPLTRSPSIVPLRKRPAWKALEEHCAKVRDLHLRQLFAEDPERSERFTLRGPGSLLRLLEEPHHQRDHPSAP